MFRIGILELGITCLVIAAAIIIPMMVSRTFTQLNKRIKKLEDDIRKKR